MKTTLGWMMLLMASLGVGEETPYAPLESLWTQDSAAALAEGPRRHAREGRDALPTLQGVRLHFTGGDTLAAELRSWSPEGLELRAPWGQALLSDLRNLREIDFLPSENRVLMDGPAALTEWQTDYLGKPAPRRIGNELSSHTELYNVICARLPGAEGPLELVVRLRRPPEVRGWGLHLFNANAHNRRGRDSLNLDLRGRELSLFVNQTLVQFPSGGTAELPEDPGPVQEVRIRVNKAEQRVQLLLNGRLVHDLREEAVSRFRTEEPFWLHIQPHQSGIVTVEELRLVKSTAGLWLPIPAEIGDRPLVVFQNGDQISAEVVEIREGRAHLRLPDGTDLKLPLAAIARILLPAGGAPAEVPPVWLRSGPARARLRLGTVAWDAEHLSGLSPHFETPLKIPLRDIDEIGW